MNHPSLLSLLLLLLLISVLLSDLAASDTASSSSTDNDKKVVVEDLNPNCEEWGSQGFCTALDNHIWMHQNCASTCSKLVPQNNPDHDSECTYWAEEGACVNNSDWMNQNCGKSCALITVNCKTWADSGECESNPNFMLKVCQSVCDSLALSEKESQNAFELDKNEVHKYGTTIGYDGKPFTMETIRERRDYATKAKQCGAPNENEDNSQQICQWNDELIKGSELKLPKNYPAKLSLGASEPSTSTSTSASQKDYELDYLHEQYPKFKDIVVYMRPKREGMIGSAVAVKVVNFTGRRLRKMWDDGGLTPGGVYNGDISSNLGGRSTLSTYDGHTFHFYFKDTDELYKTVTMKYNVHFIVFEPDKPEEQSRLLETSEAYKSAKREEYFMKLYYHEYGIPWLAKYGRPTPVLNSWPAQYVGQTHTIETQWGHWNCDVHGFQDKKCLPPSATSEDKLTLNMTVVSHAGVNGPKVFIIPNLMSDVECDHILRLGKEVIGDSIVGQGSESFKSDSRTSKTGWLPRSESPILETMSKRFADVLGLDANQLTERGIAEHLQVVQYQHNQQYNPHHDFGDSSSDGAYGQRFLTLLLYIQIPDQGGYTSFPKAFGGRGMKIKPPKRGGAVLFYSMLPDGNGDDLSLHGGMSVTSTDEKWVCNLWIHDPDRYS